MYFKIIAKIRRIATKRDIYEERAMKKHLVLPE
jgi:hypothetical protein